MKSKQLTNIYRVCCQKWHNLNSWNTTLFPPDLIGTCCVAGTIVYFTTHAPNIHDLEYYDGWVFVGKAGFYI